MSMSMNMSYETDTTDTKLSFDEFKKENEKPDIIKKFDDFFNDYIIVFQCFIDHLKHGNFYIDDKPELCTKKIKFKEIIFESDCKFYINDTDIDDTILVFNQTEYHFGFNVIKFKFYNTIKLSFDEKYSFRKNITEKELVNRKYKNTLEELFYEMKEELFKIDIKLTKNNLKYLHNKK